MARIEGFEPSQAFTPLRVFKTHLFSHLSISAYKADLHQFLQLPMSLLNKLIVNHFSMSLKLGNAILIMFLNTKVYNVYLLKFYVARLARFELANAGVWSRKMGTTHQIFTNLLSGLFPGIRVFCS